MTTMTIVKSDTILSDDLQPAGQRAGADSGDPQLRVMKLAPQAPGNLGDWESQPGGWPVVDRQDTEFAYILSGKAVLTEDKTGNKPEMGAGEVVILPGGTKDGRDV